MSDIKIPALFGCQNPQCAEDVSYPACELRVFNGKPICQNCIGWETTYNEKEDRYEPDWFDLPRIALDMVTLEHP